MNSLPIAMAFVLSLAVSLPAAAQVSDIPEGSPKAETANTPLEFARMVVAWSVFQQNSSRLAANEAQNEDVKRFANRMLDTYDDLLAEVTRAAQSEGLSQGEMPRIMETSHRRKMTELERTEPERVGELYIQTQNDALQELIAMFENYADKGGELAVMAKETLPVLRDQLMKANELAG